MEYWGSAKKTRSVCRELKTIECIDGRLNHERNKNQYLMKKNDSLRNTNQDFAKSHENLQIKISELAAEKDALFKKNVSLVFQVNHLKKELISYKEILCKSSSKNKALLLNIKSSYDELIRNIKYLEDFVVSLPDNNGSCLFENQCDVGYNLRYEMPSPSTYRILPINRSNRSLSPILEEKSNLSSDCSSSLKKSRSRSGSHCMKPSDNFQDKDNENIQPESCRRTPQKSYALRKDIHNGDFLNIIDEGFEGTAYHVPSSELQTNTRCLNEKMPVNNLEPSKETEDETYLRAFLRNSTMNKCQRSNEINYFNENSEQQTLFRTQENDLDHNIPDLISGKLNKPRCFYPPILNEVENAGVSHNRLSETPLTNRKYFIGSPKVNSLETPTNQLRLTHSFDYRVKNNPVKLFTHEKIKISESNSSEISLKTNKSKKGSALEGKRKLKNSNVKQGSSKKKRIKRDSVFEVTENIVDEAAEDKDENIFEVEHLRKSSEKKPNKIELDSSHPVKTCKKNREDKIKKDTALKTKNIVDCNLIVKEPMMVTRSRSKGTKIDYNTDVDDKENSGKVRSLEKSKKKDGVEVCRVRSRKTTKSQVKEKHKRTRTVESNPEDKASNIINSSESEENCTNKCKILPISTPNSNSGPPDYLNFHKFSVSPIPKPIQENTDMSPEKIDNKAYTNDNFSINYLLSNIKESNSQNNIQNVQKRIVLNEVLKSCENSKTATKTDKDIIKKVLLMINDCCDKKEAKNMETNQTEEQDGKKSATKDTGVSIKSYNEDINLLVSALSPSLASYIKSLDIQDNSIGTLQEE